MAAAGDMLAAAISPARANARKDFKALSCLLDRKTKPTRLRQAVAVGGPWVDCVKRSLRQRQRCDHCFRRGGSDQQPELSEVDGARTAATSSIYDFRMTVL